MDALTTYLLPDLGALVLSYTMALPGIKVGDNLTIREMKVQFMGRVVELGPGWLCLDCQFGYQGHQTITFNLCNYVLRDDGNLVSHHYNDRPIHLNDLLFSCMLPLFLTRKLCFYISTCANGVVTSSSTLGRLYKRK